MEEVCTSWNGIRHQKIDAGFAFACLCVISVIVANVLLLISVNLWIAVLPLDNLEHNSSQLAIVVVSNLLMVLFFTLVTVVFAAVFGARSLWIILVDTQRVGGRLHRLLLIMASGFSNGLSGVLAVYAMTFTPEFVQAVLLCSIPFSAQAWTVLLIPLERQRRYLALFFVVAFVLFIAGVLLSSLSAFLQTDASGQRASLSWALLYLLSAVIFGLWCVVQRLYLDAIVKVAPMPRSCVRDGETESVTVAPAGDETTHRCGHEAPSAVEPISGHSVAAKGDTGPREVSADEHLADDEEAVKMVAKTHQWGRQSVDANAAKLVLLLGGLLFQLFISFVIFPVDAIPWFGTSATVAEAWHGFADTVDFLFASWHNIRYGLLYSLGFIISFIGCTFLNEHSPTLASLVLQLAGPITSLVLILVPQWDVYKIDVSVWQKLVGVGLLLLASLCYHVWEQQSVKALYPEEQEEEVTASLESDWKHRESPR